MLLMIDVSDAFPSVTDTSDRVKEKKIRGESVLLDRADWLASSELHLLESFSLLSTFYSGSG